MPITVNNLSIWDIGFRWADLDPDRFWFRLPFPVKDNFRVLMDAIITGEILCETLTLAKLPRGSKADPKYYIRTYLDEVYDCINGHGYDRKLLKWAMLDRVDFSQWTEARGIPKPEFWFPEGWKLEYDLSEFKSPALWAEHIEPSDGGDVSISYRSAPWFNDEINPDELPLHNSSAVRECQKIKVACQQIAKVMWKEDIDRTYSSIINDPLIQNFGGASHYTEGAVKEWLKEIAPLEVRNRRGRPRKKGAQGEEIE